MRLPKSLFVLALLALLAVSSHAFADEPADINAATAADLQRVKGIGPKTAANIIEHRDGKGGYKKLADLLEVNRIGPKTLAKIACHFQVPAEGPRPCGETGDGGAPTVGKTKGGKVNLNLADEFTLQTIPGIGPKKAQAIVAYRDENGYYDSVSDLTSIKGFGPKTVAKLEAHLVTRVRVNEAGEAELRALGFANATRILEYRKIVGRFKTLKDLEQIPEIDRKLLDKLEDLLSFD